jgi:transposase-like protein
MATAKQLPKSLIEAVRYFDDLDVATDFVAQLRWPDGPTCPECGCQEYSYISTRRLWKCKSCKKQYSVKLGTIFEDSPLGLDKWLPAVWLVANSKNGISSHEAARALGVTQKSAWFMLHRIRLAMQTGSFDKMLDDEGGQVEVDETFVGGLSRNMHKSERKRKITGMGGYSGNKTIVIGARQRGGEVRTTVVDNTDRKTLKRFVTDHVPFGQTVYTDGWHGYTGLEGDYDHDTIDHMTEYVRGQVHTNGIENFWSLLKRGLHGSYVSVQPFHLFRYCDERVFTYNQRNLTDLGRFTLLLQGSVGRRLTWAELTGK